MQSMMSIVNDDLMVENSSVRLVELPSVEYLVPFLVFIEFSPSL